MAVKVCMGNEAIALGALAAGVKVAAGYPGTPSTEIIETLVAVRHPGVKVQWSTNEKVALEVAAGAAYSGARTLCTMKQVGLNVASDPLMSLAYIGIKGGMVIAVADDPVAMARAFRMAIDAGLLARQAGPGARSTQAQATSPLTGFLEALA